MVRWLSQSTTLLFWGAMNITSVPGNYFFLNFAVCHFAVQFVPCHQVLKDLPLQRAIQRIWPSKPQKGLEFNGKDDQPIQHSFTPSWNFPLVNQHSNAKWPLWRCISYWTWWYSIAMLVYQRVILYLPGIKICSCCELIELVYSITVSQENFASPSVKRGTFSANKYGCFLHLQWSNTNTLRNNKCQQTHPKLIESM